MKLFVRRFGQGNPVIILHGLLGMSDNWVTFGRRLGADFGVFIPDLRDHGQSPHHAVFNYSALSDDLCEMVMEYGLSDIILIGHSLGGKTSMEFALHHPDLLKKMIIVDIAPRSYPSDLGHLGLIRAMMEVDLTTLHSRSQVESQLEKKVPDPRLCQFLLKNIYWKDKDTLAWRPDLPVLLKNLPLLGKGITSNLRFEKPVLWIRGGRSKYVLDSDVPEILKQFPRASVETIANASHWVHADAPEEFYDRVHDFLITRQ